jgi:hypothetical protein
MTGRQLAEALLAMPDPDTPVCITLATADSRWEMPPAMLLAVVQGLDPGLVWNEPANSHYVALRAVVEPSQFDDGYGRPRWEMRIQ